MKINREGINYELTKNEVYQAHVEYVIDMYAIDVMQFIINNLGIKEIHKMIAEEHFYKMANLLYDEKLNESSNNCAIAKIVIPYLHKLGINSEYKVDDFYN